MQNCINVAALRIVRFVCWPLATSHHPIHLQRLYLYPVQALTRGIAELVWPVGAPTGASRCCHSMECRGSDGQRPTAFAAVCLGALGGAAPLLARERSGECASTAAPISCRVPTGSLPRFPGQWGRRPGGRAHASNSSSSSSWRRDLGGTRVGAGANGALFVRPGFKDTADACQASRCTERCQHLARTSFKLTMGCEHAVWWRRDSSGSVAVAILSGWKRSAQHCTCTLLSSGYGNVFWLLSGYC